MSVIIGVAGTKQSGKSSLCKYLASCFNAILFNARAKEKNKQEVILSKILQHENGEVIFEPGYEFPLYCDILGGSVKGNVKVYSFADTLKEFCINVMGLKQEQCYGTDEQKNSYTDLVWDNLPHNIKVYYSDKTIETIYEENGRKSRYEVPIERSGFMTGREVMQVFGTDVMRNMWDGAIWAKATIRAIKKDNYPFALISDLRFKSEADLLLSQPDSYLIYLQRKLFNDHHPSEVDLVDYDFTKWGNRLLKIDNTDKEISEKNAEALNFLKQIISY